MAKEIRTLGGDIFNHMQSQKRMEPEEVAEKMSRFGSSTGMLLNRALTERDGERKPMTIYASELGKRCMRQLWYTHNTPKLSEELPPKTKFKFLYGDLIEETVLTLAELSGHSVQLRQETKEYKHPTGWTVRGRMDAVIDGVLVDVKSSSSFGMKKFAEGLTDETDSFGYRQQLNFYNGVATPAFEEQGFVAVDKQNGDIEFYESQWMPSLKLIDFVIENIESRDEPPVLLNAEEEASFRNSKLCITCSYCPFKRVCWREANKGAGLVRVNYANGPAWLTRMNKAPSAPLLPEPAPVGTHDEIEKVKHER